MQKNKIYIVTVDIGREGDGFETSEEYDIRLVGAYSNHEEAVFALKNIGYSEENDVVNIIETEVDNKNISTNSLKQLVYVAAEEHYHDEWW